MKNEIKIYIQIFRLDIFLGFIEYCNVAITLTKILTITFVEIFLHEN